ncbi:hypothetical protein [Paenibacillus apiarius]|uniref:Uncharacterized protein n=1 Tax=Paenibacillus apiarius TaxID=46240 RepID=A0ABT4DZX6_9BACL|nr:hypothetical protein [Paenibacillus apiarius]MCY9516994.1 hypothetical protein [Paenibacillus apiarius]MCY9522770.1 hypothetical protein [Paenibacillus apiarius]MCY9554679.1 hypothetical protein [Paenibacillus apiarius]MCY9557336.1 hypothetical protein [Paenibacillus apiarius]MCY9682485.1 hypothetical protein [Paenibacillus apiarius]
MGMANEAGWIQAFGSEDNMPELLCVIENGSKEQSAEAAQALFEQICRENDVDEAAFPLIDPLLDILTIRHKSVAKATILNGIAQVLRCAMPNSLPFGVTPLRYCSSHGYGMEEQTGAAATIARHWHHTLRSRYAEWSVLAEEGELTAIQAVYVLHWLQWDDPQVENKLLRAAFYGESSRLRLNALIALADYRRRAGKPFNPSIAFGQHQDDELYEAVRAVCAALTSSEAQTSQVTAKLLQGCALPRLDRIQFPWADGAISSLCAQAACYLFQNGTPIEERAVFWVKALDTCIHAHQLRSRKVVWEIGESTVQWDEEWLQWNWNGPMLVADGMLLSLFPVNGDHLANEGEELTLPSSVSRAIKLCLQHQVEMPNAERYGVGRVIRQLYRFIT